MTVNCSSLHASTGSGVDRAINLAGSLTGPPTHSKLTAVEFFLCSVTSSWFSTFHGDLDRYFGDLPFAIDRGAGVIIRG